MVTGKRFVLIMILYTSQKSTIDIVFFFRSFAFGNKYFWNYFFLLKKLMFHLLHYCFKGISEYRLRSFNRSAQVTTASVCKILSILSNPES